MLIKKVVCGNRDSNPGYGLFPNLFVSYLPSSEKGCWEAHVLPLDYCRTIGAFKLLKFRSQSGQRRLHRLTRITHLHLHH